MRALLAAVLLAGTALAQPADFVRIPPGSLGHTRFDRPFWMGTTEVTVRQFARFVKATGYRTTAETANAPRTWKAAGYRVSASQPVVYVTVKDAAAYCAWAGGRLPRDEEWEYAARAGATTRHYWGDAIDGRYLWYRANSEGRPHPVGTKLPNRWGLYDVEGNVWEWTMSEPVKGEPWANRRGASWIDCDEIESEPGRRNSPLIGLAIFFKIAVSYGHRYDDIGFRCLRDEAR
ncbi:MAG TPA: formylglycine-generating enzyme family protein [Bryobacteraceae bacterium]|jgi:formylglycine-generating enzyme required for sulfatase activity